MSVFLCSVLQPAHAGAHIHERPHCVSNGSNTSETIQTPTFVRNPFSAFYTPVEECHNLCASTVAVGAKRGFTGANRDALADSPADSWCIVGIRKNIREVRSVIHHGFSVCSPQESHDLCSGTSGIRTERGCAGANRDPLLHCPQYRIIVVVSRSHIRKGIYTVLRCRRTSGAPQESDCLCSGASCIRAERSAGGTSRNSVFHCPLNCFIVVVICGDIHKATL